LAGRREKEREQNGQDTKKDGNIQICATEGERKEKGIRKTRKDGGKDQGTGTSVVEANL